MPRAFGATSTRIDTWRRLDLAEMNVETVRTHQHVAFLQVGPDVIPIDVSLHFVGQQNIDYVGLLGGLGRTYRLELVAHRQFVIFAAGPLTNDYVQPTVA